MCGSDHSDINGGNAKWYNPFGTSLAISYKVRYTLAFNFGKNKSDNSDRKWVNGYLGLELGGGNLQGEDIEELMGLMEKSSVLIMVVVAWVYVFENSAKYTLKLL